VTDEFMAKLNISKKSKNAIGAAKSKTKATLIKKKPTNGSGSMTTAASPDPAVGSPGTVRNKSPQKS
jgi:hypothetical protein